MCPLLHVSALCLNLYVISRTMSPWAAYTQQCREPSSRLCWNRRLLSSRPQVNHVCTVHMTQQKGNSTVNSRLSCMNPEPIVLFIFCTCATLLYLSRWSSVFWLVWIDRVCMCCWKYRQCRILTTCSCTVILSTRLMHNCSLRWTCVPHYHGYQRYERGTEWEAESLDVVLCAFRLPHVLHGEPVVENVPAHLHGAAHHLGHTKADWTLPPGTEELFLYFYFSNGWTVYV